MSTAALAQALIAGTHPPLRRLPQAVEDLLRELRAAPRLAAHLRLVHDVACQLTEALTGRYPQLPMDRAAVEFGAATHDIGKAVHPEELSQPGSAHEAAGRELLLRHGVPAELARFAATHASWTLPAVPLDDVLVSVADKVWKGKRVAELEELLVDRVAAATAGDRWQTFLDIDDLLEGIAAGADDRLAFQNMYPTWGTS